jgi:eukaryotic-like serine/threonine-protein kinase
VAVAHEHGLMHRDLKPANIKVRGDGTVKVLDFGLAKLVEAAPSTSSGRGTPSAAHSPAAVSPVVTAIGVILGTAAYMSPEQARGLFTDKRTDVWAFGCVLFEMLTGKQAFNGEDTSDTLASVLRSQPDWNALPVETPPPISRLLRRTLEKEPRRRLSDMADARLEIEDAQALAGADESGETTRPGATTRLERTLSWAIAGALAVVLITTLVVWSSWRAAPIPVSQHLSVDLGADAFLGDEPPVAHHGLRRNLQHLAGRGSILDELRSSSYVSSEG